ncbi:alpha/beta-hydrolase, partial [Aspergillus aculeatinus CBS 121060]
ASPNPTVTIASGIVIGTTQALPSSTETANVYLGIPFAQSPPVRFAPPEAPAPWPSPIYAQEFKPSCMQVFADFNSAYTDNPWTEDEDCLYLNVWTPRGSNATDLEVMVWIYGGNLAWGTSSDPFTEGTALAVRGNIIVVSFNYRLSIFGFSNSPSLPLTHRNAGFLDQRLALDWVQRNIHDFGGNASKVTIFGQSAGGYSVQQLLAAPPGPKDRPPFRAAIMQSFARAFGGNGTANYLNAAEHFNCTDEEVLACLRRVDAVELRDYAAQAELDFAPVEDHHTCITNVTDHILNGPGLADVPLLLGSTRDELSAMVYALSSNATDPVHTTWHRVHDRLITKLLFSPSSSSLSKRNYGLLVRLASDIVFTCPTSRACNVTTASSSSSSSSSNNKRRSGVWRYRWSTEAAAPGTIIPNHGAVHGAEIPAIFGTHLPDTPADTLAMTAYMQELWAGFAKHPVAGP